MLAYQMEIGKRLGLTGTDWDFLLNQGRVGPGLAGRLGLQVGEAEAFLKNEWPSVDPPESVAKLLGLGRPAAREFLDVLGPQGRLGLLLGLLLMK